ncbi:MAG: serine/threonine protein kinase, partial [Myxococcaceae bacterium]|nr:serine/threonine protein kinase [Myxococcaceae bacterium]
MSGADFHAGRKVGKYEILTLLSMGGMAELFLAYTAGPGGFRKFVALKQILPDIKKDESFVKMFLDEARITAAFSHSNIGQVFDLGEEEGELYLAMEFISGQNLEYLSKVCRKTQTPIPVGFSAMAVRDTCLGLHYAHHFVDPSGRPAPVIHRDVSPKNVMVTYDGNVKVIDFGIAKARGRLNRTQAGMVKGTSGYMSPEQVRNEPLDERSDLFSAAVMLWELVCGQRLFDGPSDAATMIAIVEKPIPDPRTINPEVPPALAQVILKALSRDREDRYATGKELARAIDAAMGPEIYDEDRAAAFMQRIFAEKVKKTRALLEMASRDDGELSRAAEGLRDEAEAASPSPKTRRPSTPGARTPPGRTPRAGAKPVRDSQRLPTRTPPSRTPG